MRASLGPTVCIFPMAQITTHNNQQFTQTDTDTTINLHKTLKNSTASRRLDVQTLHRHTIYKFRACAMLRHRNANKLIEEAAGRK